MSGASAERSLQACLHGEVILMSARSLARSDDGTLLAYGSSDLSVGILDAVTLRVRVEHVGSMTRFR